MNKKQWFCLRCKKPVEIHVLGWGTGFKMCKKCFSWRIIELETMNEKEFEKFAKEFKEKTDKKLKFTS